MNEAVPERSGHTGVDLSYDIPGIGGSGLDNIHRDAETAQAVRIRRRYANQGNIYRYSPAVKFIRYLREEYRRIIPDAK